MPRTHAAADGAGFSSGESATRPRPGKRLPLPQLGPTDVSSANYCKATPMSWACRSRAISKRCRTRCRPYSGRRRAHDRECVRQEAIVGRCSLRSARRSRRLDRKMVIAPDVATADGARAVPSRLTQADIRESLSQGDSRTPSRRGSGARNLSRRRGGCGSSRWSRRCAAPSPSRWTCGKPPPRLVGDGGQQTQG